MTEKRFTVIDWGIGMEITDHQKNKEYSNLDDICEELNALHEEKEELQEVINEITYNTTQDKIEIEHINTIYKELGFDGVIDYAKDKLSGFGAVREVEDGLWVMATGGWSDHEHWIDCLNDMTCFMSSRGHYIAWERGGAFYYTKEPYVDVKVVKK